MSSFVRFSTPTFAAFAWAALKLTCGSGLAALVRVFFFTAANEARSATPSVSKPAVAPRSLHRWTPHTGPQVEARRALGKAQQ
jgi:hypothetical protein